MLPNLSSPCYPSAIPVTSTQLDTGKGLVGLHSYLGQEPAGTSSPKGWGTTGVLLLEDRLPQECTWSLLQTLV